MEGQTANGAGNIPQHDHGGEVDLKSKEAKNDGEMEEEVKFHMRKERKSWERQQRNVYRRDAQMSELPVPTYQEQQSVACGGDVPVICI